MAIGNRHGQAAAHNHHAQGHDERRNAAKSYSNAVDRAESGTNGKACDKDKRNGNARIKHHGRRHRDYGND